AVLFLWRLLAAGVLSISRGEKKREGQWACGGRKDAGRNSQRPVGLNRSKRCGSCSMRRPGSFSEFPYGFSSPASSPISYWFSSRCFWRPSSTSSPQLSSPPSQRIFLTALFFFAVLLAFLAP